MPTHREEILAALFERLRMIPAAVVRREEPLPEKVPATGLVILRDGDPGEPEVLLSPLSYLWRHRAEIEVVVQLAPAADATAVLDALLREIDATGDGGVRDDDKTKVYGRLQGPGGAGSATRRQDGAGDRVQA